MPVTLPDSPELRAGGSWAEIADELGIGLGAAHRAFQRISKSLQKWSL